MGGVDTAICLGAGAGFIANYSSQVGSNMDNGMSFFDAVYYENIDWAQAGASTVAGAVAGGAGFLVGAGASGLVGGLLPQATTLVGAVANGAIAGAVGGIIGGAAAGASGQLVYNALTPCTNWNENVVRATVYGAGAGGIVGGVVGGVSGGMRFGSNTSPGILSSGGSRTGIAPNSPRYLEYKALRQQGYNATEAFNLMKQFNAGVNPNSDWAFHFTNRTGGSGIVKSGEIWQSSGFTLRGEGVYVGTTPTPNFFLKRTPFLGWGLSTNNPVRIPIYVPSQTMPIGQSSEILSNVVDRAY